MLSTVPLPTPSLKNTACVFVDRKNYRLQDIQLSKNLAATCLLQTLARGRVSAPRDSNSHAFAWLANRSSLGPAVLRLDLIGAKVGGEYRARTGDLLVANQALSQLS